MAPSPQEIGGQVQQHQNPKMRPGEEVVISGISGIFPKSDNTTQFAENLFNNVDMVTEDDIGFHHPEAPKHLGKINGVDKFDSQFFKVTYNHVLDMEPMSRKLLEQAYMAMYDSGINPLAYKERKVGVFIGSSYTDTSNFAMYNALQKKGFILSGCGKSMFSNRISFWIDAKGPSYTLDCSCASSMVCLDHAYRAMTEGECEAAIVGGCNLCLEPHLGLNMRKSGYLCLDGKTKCFDKHGDGSVRAEAVACLFLQKAKDAKRIYAEVCLSQVTYGLKPDAQFIPLRPTEEIVKLLQNFYSEACVSPKEIEYVEADGSGIAEIDSNELNAIGQVFSKLDHAVKVGCVKSNMGNSEPASGICALAKVCLAYHRGKLPANLHYSEPLDVTAVKQGKVQILQKNEEFSRGYTAINNFSYNGTNCHVLLKGHFKPKDISKYKCNIPRLVLISGRQDACIEKIINILKNQPIDPEVIGMLHNIYQIGTPGHTCRGYTVLDTNEKNETVSLAQNIEHYSGAKRPLCLVFSGMGSQWPGMAADLMRIPTFANAIQRCHKALEPLGVDLINVITADDKTVFDKILNCFIGISAVQIGLSDVLKEIGVFPDYIIGHSQGEMGCAYFDNCFTHEDMILAAYSRGYVSATSNFIKGSMAAVGMGYKDILPLCPPEIDIACHNSNESATLSGPAEKLKEFVEELTAKGIFAREVPSTNIAFHSRYIADAGPEFLKRLKEIIKTPIQRSEKWICTSIPEERWDEALAKYSSAEYHTNNLMSPVYFEEGARHIPNNAVVVEVAPHGLLQSILKRSLPECTHISLTRRGETNQVKFLLDAIGKLYNEGYNFKMDALYPKIDFPVSTETQLISHYVDWEHSETWPNVICKYKNITTRSREFIMSVHDDEYKYFADNIRDGNLIFPESAVLFVVWETLAMFMGVKYTDLSVIFREVQFYGEVIIDDEEALKLNISISKGNDYFEVSHDCALIASGYIAGVTKYTFENIQTGDDCEENDIVLNSEDIYTEFHTRGITYKGQFRSIQTSNFERNKAQIKWTHDWVIFLDSLIQLNVLARNYEGVSVPKIIKKLVISLDDHFKDSQVADENEMCYDAQLNKLCNITRCGGVEIREIIFDDKAIKKIQPDVVNLVFVPHTILGEVSIETALQVQLQIVAENTSNEIIRITEVAGTYPCLTKCIDKIAENIPNVGIETRVVDTDNLEQVKNSNIIILQDFLENGKKINDVINIVSKNSFILTFGQDVNNNKQFKAISTMTIGKKDLTLLRKTDDKNDVTFITIVGDEKFSWVPNVQSELQKTKPVVLVSERQPHCGTLGLVKKIRKEHKNLSAIILDDYNAPAFDKNKPMFQDQLQKNLSINIFQKGQWGGYYYIKSTLSSNVKNFNLINSVPGDINGLMWAETPNVVFGNNTVQVCYAGPSVRDAEKAVGLLDVVEDGFGLDFSGFDSKGDRVMGLLPRGAISSTVLADPDLIWPVPTHWSLEDAATVPLPYVYACYCLAIQCQVLKGHKIFVNGGAGAFGQAVISICLSLNCTVFTSVSDLQKKKLLLNLFPQLKECNIGFSRNGNFRNIVMLNTNGRGCDFVINCASGESREAAMKCVKDCGIFLDISKYDILLNKPIGMSFVSGEKTYKAANLSSIFRPENIEEKKMLQLIIAQGIINGTVKPVTRVVYPTTDVTRAFRLLASNKHRGRVLLKIKDAEISNKALGVISRQSYSSKGTYIVVCDQTELGFELSNRLIKRGVRKLMLHLKSKSVSGYAHLKLASWMKLGVQIKISSDKLHSDKHCVQLLQDSEKLGKVQGIFIVRESIANQTACAQEDFIDKYEKTIATVANLDVLSRNNCPEISSFVVISRETENVAEEYAISVIDKICQARSAVGLSALSLKVAYLDEQNANLKNKERLQPLSISAALNGLEKSLKEKHSSAMCYTLRKRRDTDYFNKVSKSLGVKSIDELDQTLKVEECVTSHISVEELKALIKNTYKIDYTAERLRKMSIASLKTFGQNRTKENTKFESGLGAFYTFVDKDEFQATDIMFSMSTIIEKTNETRELNENAAHLMLIPGFEGHHQIFKPTCERLKIRAMTFQMGPDVISDSITDISLNILKHIKKTFKFNPKFYLLGYSFGVNVALEVAALLEKEGHVGVVYCLDSSPDALKEQLNAYIGNVTEIELQNIVIEHFFKLMTGLTDKVFCEEIVRLESWHDKVVMFVNKLKSIVSYTSEYARSVVETAYSRILLAKSYEPQMKLESEIVLMKGISHPKFEYNADDYGLSKYSKNPIKVFNIVSDHATAPLDCRVPNIVNKMLDPEFLEEFKKVNLCDTYAAVI